jgi:hypothetical protein
VIDFIFHHIWLECQLVMGTSLVYIFFNMEEEERKREWTRSNMALVIGLTISGPIGIFAMFCCIVHDEMQGYVRRDVRKVLAKWETKARAQETVYNMSNWDWHGDKKYEEIKYITMRETIDFLSDKELKLLLGQNVVTLDKEIVDAVANEIIHREIVKA